MDETLWNHPISGNQLLKRGTCGPRFFLNRSFSHEIDVEKIQYIAVYDESPAV
jgi:hypothetical protein